MYTGRRVADHGEVRRALVLLGLIAAIVPAGAAAAPTPLRSLDTQILARINAIRADHGLPLVRANAALAKAAALHSRQLALRGYFAHESPGGGVFWKRLLAFYPQRGYSDWYVGENLVWAAPDLSASRAIDLWLASPPHRENLLDPKWREVGLAAVEAASAPGVYGGQQVTIVTCDFGVRR